MPSAADAKVFQPSTFASRRAEAEAFNAAHPPERWLYMGTRELQLEALGRNGTRRVVEVEYFADLNDHRKLYARERGGVLQPANTIEGKEDDVTALPSMGSMPRMRRYGTQPDTVTPLDDFG